MNCPVFYASDIDIVAAQLKQGAVIAFPTETVYGLGCDATHHGAIGKVFEYKGRPKKHPVIIHVDSPSKVVYLADEIPKSFWELAKHFWPGPLTIILKKSKHVSDMITGGHPTVAVRIPNHPMTLDLLKHFRKGMIGPSANLFGQISPTSPAHVLNHLGGKIDGVLSGGPCEVGIESTIVHCQEDKLTLLRQGMITQADIQSVLPDVHIESASTKRVASPGTHLKHYAPTKKMIMVASDQLQSTITKFKQQNISVSGFGLSQQSRMLWHTMPDCPRQYANRLYQVMHDLDMSKAALIICEQPPNASPTWGAIHDRLNKACFNLSTNQRNAANDNTRYGCHGFQI